MKRERIHAIDSLKGIACLVIALLWHYLNMQPRALGMPLQSVFGVFYDYGKYFVELFFMLSGFVMAYCYKGKIQAGEDFFPYMAKRYRHLYPLFYTTLLYMLVFQVLYNAVTGTYYVYQVSVWHLILNVLCIQTGWLSLDQSFNGPAWCISVEIFLYILYYITTRAAKKDNNTYIIISGILFVLASVVLYRGGVSYPILNEYMMRGVSCFYAGVLLCELNDWLDAGKKEKLAMTLFILFLAFRLALHFMPDHSFWENERNGRMALILLEWPILIFASINLPWFRKVLEIRPLRYLGTISMDIFLWHIPVQITIKCVDKIFGLDINYGSLSVWALYIVMVLATAAASNAITKKIKREHYLLKGLAAIACCALVLGVTGWTGVRLKPVLNNSLSYSDHADTVRLTPGTCISEDFYVGEDAKMRQIQFYTITWGNTFADDQRLHISVRERDTEEVLYQADRNMSLFKDARYYSIQLNEPVDLAGDTWYTLSFESSAAAGQEMALMMIGPSHGNGQHALIDGAVTADHVSAKIWVRK